MLALGASGPEFVPRTHKHGGVLHNCNPSTTGGSVRLAQPSHASERHCLRKQGTQLPSVLYVCSCTHLHLYSGAHTKLNQEKNSFWSHSSYQHWSPYSYGQGSSPSQKKVRSGPMMPASFLGLPASCRLCSVCVAQWLHSSVISLSEGTWPP